MTITPTHVAGIDAVFGKDFCTRWEFGQKFVTVVVEVTHQWHCAACCIKPFTNVFNGRCCLVCVDRNADEFRSCFSQLNDLFSGCRTVGGIGIGHRLYDNGRIPSDPDTPYTNLPGGSAHNAAGFKHGLP